MKRIIYMLLLCSMLCLITACENKDMIEEQSSTGFQEHATETTTKEITATTTEAIIESTTKATMETTTELHSPLYNDKYTVEEVIRYFSEVVFDVEYSTGDGNYELVQKWDIPLYYRITGEATQKDIEVLESFFAELNQIEGFPGIYEAAENYWPNVNIGFYDREAFYDKMGRVVNDEESDGAVEYWYGTDTNDIFTMDVGYRTDIGQYVRNSVLLEEIVNGLGVTDTGLREDSIVYQEYSEAQELSEMDWLILKLLYYPDIKCGMNPEQCEEIIRKIYY